MENIYVKINNLRLVGNGDSFMEINPFNLSAHEINSNENKEINKNLIIDFDEYNTMLSLYSDFSINKKIEEVKEIIRNLKDKSSYPTAEKLADYIRRTLKLRNDNFTANCRRSMLYVSFK